MKMSDAPGVIGRTKRIAVIATGGTIAQSVAARAGRAHRRPPKGFGPLAGEL